MTKEEAKITLAKLKRYMSGGGVVDKSVNKAIDMAIEALSKPEPHWIPVTERLPDNSRNVLITHKGGVSMAWYNGSYFEKGASTHHRKMKTVTAWCELPESYKEQRHE